MSNMTQRELFDKLDKATSVVAVEKAFDAFDESLSPRAKIGLLLDCADVEYDDDINLDTMTELEIYTNEVTSFLTKSFDYPESKYI